VYDRNYEDYTLRFEASGGLLHDSLVLQDKETDSYWSIIKGISIGGELAETSLKELPFGTKTQWKEWVSLYPDTRVLSVDGQEHYPLNPYRDYFDSENGFGGRIAPDQRLGGVVLEIDSRSVFLYRPVDSDIVRSTVAYISYSGGFARSGESWIHSASETQFNADRGVFEGAPPELKRMQGFDTFWYTWSPLHPETKILGDPAVSR